MMKYKLVVLTIMLIFHDMAFSRDFGVVGQTFRVAEESFIAMLKKRLERVDIAKIEQQIQTTAKEQVNNPMPVNGISPATKNRTFYFDPSYTLDQDVVLPCGKILYKAGTRVNPLEQMDLHRQLLFIDGRQQQQVAWVKERLNTQVSAQVGNEKNETNETIEDRVILVGGSVFRIKEQLGSQHEDKVYFDQVGELTTKFGIKATPAIVVQDKTMLKIEEVLLNE